MTHSQVCKLGIKGKDTNIKRDFAGSVELVHENKDFRIFINDLLLLRPRHFGDILRPKHWLPKEL